LNESWAVGWRKPIAKERWFLQADYGLQAGVFTKDINRVLRAANALETGGVWINEVSTYRQDNYPYGGVKQSGISREGVKYVIQDMAEMKIIGNETGIGGQLDDNLVFSNSNNLTDGTRVCRADC
jgi:hypothetical protein